jgi:hypothetical protein
MFSVREQREHNGFGGDGQVQNLTRCGLLERARGHQLPTCPRKQDEMQLDLRNDTFRCFICGNRQHFQDESGPHDAKNVRVLAGTRLLRSERVHQDRRQYIS